MIFTEFLHKVAVVRVEFLFLLGTVQYYMNYLPFLLIFIAQTKEFLKCIHKILESKIVFIVGLYLNLFHTVQAILRFDKSICVGRLLYMYQLKV